VLDGVVAEEHVRAEQLAGDDVLGIADVRADRDALAVAGRDRRARRAQVDAQVQDAMVLLPARSPVVDVFVAVARPIGRCRPCCSSSFWVSDDLSFQGLGF
jgi:hypothetical protein